MPLTSSLTNRIFVACTLLATLSLGFAFYFVNARATSEAEAELRRGLNEAGKLVDQNRVGLTDTFTRLARLVADLPKLKAAVETGDPPTVQPLADEYRDQVKADVLVLTGRHGALLGKSGAGAEELTVPAALKDTASVEEISTFMPHSRGIVQVVSVPIFIERDTPDVLGRLTVGFFLDDRFAEQIKRLTASEIAFGAGNRILASTLPAGSRDALASVIGSHDIATVRIGDEDFLALARPLVSASADATAKQAMPVVLTLRSRTERLRFLNTIRTGLEGALVFTLLLATIVSYAVARTVTRPLSAITSAMSATASRRSSCVNSARRSVLSVAMMIISGLRISCAITVERRPSDDRRSRWAASAWKRATDSVSVLNVEASRRASRITAPA